MTKPSLLILAAGMGSRYGGLKQLDSIGPTGETIMDYSVYDAIQAGFGKVIFVIRNFFKEEFELKVSKKYRNLIEIAFVTQELDMIPKEFPLHPQRVKPWGTGHAVLVAAKQIETPFAVINADDYYGQESFKIMANYLNSIKGQKGAFSMVGFKAGNTLSKAGTVSRGVCTYNKERFLTSVQEHHKIERSNSGKIQGENSRGKIVEIPENSFVSMNMWGFTPDIFDEGQKLFIEFLKENGQESKSEFYIPFIVNTLIDENYAKCKVLSTPDLWFGITYKQDKEFVATKINTLVQQGVYPSPLF
ncbi:MAG: sugar phosphate nucleotidyltransferase [Bacteroidales bacterium]